MELKELRKVREKYKLIRSTYLENDRNLLEEEVKNDGTLNWKKSFVEFLLLIGD